MPGERCYRCPLTRLLETRFGGLDTNSLQVNRWFTVACNEIRSVALVLDYNWVITISRFDAGLHLQTTRHRLVVLLRLMATLARTSFRARFYLQSLCQRLVVLGCHITNLDVGLDLKTASHLLAVVGHNPTSFHIRFDFHGCISFPYFTVKLRTTSLLQALMLVLTFSPCAMV